MTASGASQPKPSGQVQIKLQVLAVDLDLLMFLKPARQTQLVIV
jgi:hypothetical protein